MFTGDPTLRGYLGGSRLTHIPDPGSNEANPAWQQGASIPGMLQRSKIMRPLGMYANLLRTNPLAATLLTSAIGGVGGYALGKIRDQNPRSTALTGALMGAAGAGLAGSSMNSRWLASQPKQASSMGSSHELNMIAEKLMEDRSIGSSVQSKLLGLLNQLSPSQIRILADAIKGAFGASAGAVISRYLLGLGMGGSLLGAAVGGLGMVANDVFGHHNSLGQGSANQSPFGGPSFDF